ncbi:MAG: DJ-1/PfpI family protein [Dehalococcoidia bacterium]|nr:MAG: DJ-1/PfpI family protein [Dehalococcoidia bacterium]
MAFNIAFVLFPDFEELDYAGPYEVFGTAARYVDKEWRVFTVAAQRTTRGTNGMHVTADYLFDDSPAADLIVVPGGFGTRPGVDDAALVGYVKRAGEGAKYVTSVCTGALLLQRAGFLAGRRATTHWGARKELAALGGVEVVEERWVQDGNVITAAGVSAGIDMALYVVGLLKSPDEARKVQRIMEYEPSPPYATVS